MNSKCEHCGQFLPGEILWNGIISIDVEKREIFIRGKKIEFSPKEFNLLLFFVKNKGRVLTFRVLMENIWGKGYANEFHYLRVILVEIRKKLSFEPSLKNLIVPKRTIGYQMVNFDAPIPDWIV